MDKSIILAGDFNSNRQSEKKIGKGITADHYPQSTWPICHLIKIPPSNSRMHHLFKRTQNICHHKPYSGLILIYSFKL